MVSIVVDNDVTFTAGGPAKATPLEVFENLPTMLNRLSARFDRTAEGTVILAGDIVRRLGLPEHAPATDEAAQAHPWLTPARERGWHVRKCEPWMTFHRKGSATVHIGVMPWLDSESFELVDPDPAVTAYRMEWISSRMRGTAFRARPGVVGTAAVRRFIPGREPTWQPQNRGRVRPIAMDVAWEQRYVWESPAADVLTEGARWLHGWDVRQQFLAAASLAELSRTPLLHTGVRDFDGTPGYWRIVVPPWNLAHILPHPAGQHDPEDLVWVTTPRMTLLHELADTGVIPEPVVLDSWTAPHASRLLRPWAENIRDMIAEAKKEPIAADAVVLSKAGKHLYTHAIDMWGGETSSILRRDWMHTIHGLGGCQVFRKLWKQYKTNGLTPVKIYADCLYYASDHIDPEIDRPSTFEVSPFMGKLRYKQSEEL